MIIICYTWLGVIYIWAELLREEGFALIFLASEDYAGFSNENIPDGM
jgi:hypothetical protein